MKLINEAEVYSTWSPIIESATGIADREKLGWMSEYCHYHKLYEDAHNYAHLNPGMSLPGMGHATTPTVATSQANFGSAAKGSGDKPFSLLPLALQVAGQTVGLDLVPVVPMSGPMGILTYLDFVYAGGPDIEKTAAGTDGLNPADATSIPSLFKHSAAWAGSALTAGNNYVLGDHTTASSLNWGLIATYVGTSRVDGHQIWAPQKFADGKNAVIFYSSSATAITAVVETTEHMTGVSDTKTLVDFVNTSDGVFELSSQANVTTQLALSRNEGMTTVFNAGTDMGDHPSAAVLVKALEDHITGYSGDSYSNNNPMRRGKGESTQDNLLGLSLYNKSVAAETFQVAAAVTREQVQDLKQFGIDAVAQVESVLVNELTQSINKNIIDRLFALGTSNSVTIASVEGVNFSFEFGDNALEQVH